MAIVLNDEKSIGLIIGSSFNTLPPGYLLCDGSAISRTTYADLFSVIGVTYGSGNGSTTFNLPDLRGVVPRGAGTSSGYTQNYTIALGAKTNDAVQGHIHSFSAWSSERYGSSNNSGSTWLQFSPGDLIGNASSTVGLSSSDGTNGTPRTDTETRMKSLGINFFIKF